MKLILLVTLLCFSFIISSKKSKCDVDIKKRKECGFLGLSEEKCLKKKCCYKISLLTNIWCFHYKEEEEVEEDERKTEEQVEDEYEEEEKGEKEEEEEEEEEEEKDEKETTKKVANEIFEEQKIINSNEKNSKVKNNRIGIMSSAKQIEKAAKEAVAQYMEKKKLKTHKLKY